MAPCPVTVTFVLGGPEVGFRYGTAIPPTEAAQVSAQVDLDALRAYREVLRRSGLGCAPLAPEEGRHAEGRGERTPPTREIRAPSRGGVGDL